MLLLELYNVVTLHSKGPTIRREGRRIQHVAATNAAQCDSVTSAGVEVQSCMPRVTELAPRPLEACRYR
eukprot:scaffold7480_cov430-Prasinococcus_capsulatus_cf.AAC.4